MYKYTNKHNVSLALAVFLMYDSYDSDSRNNVISATSLMKPIRQLVLIQQNKKLAKEIDISDLVASRMGTAIHDGCQQAWEDQDNVAAALKVLGASEEGIQRVVINPPEGSLGEGQIPVYVEQRHEKKVDEYIITGKFDLVLDGTVNDYKSTSVWSYIYDSKADDYTKQGSIYRWLTPHKITSDYININYIFTDWSAAKSKQDSQYPQQRILTKKYPIWSESETDHWVRNKLDILHRSINNTQEALPECTKEELWASEPVYKYYKDPAKKTRATKNFSAQDEAFLRLANDGGTGEVVEVPGEVKACRYCPVVGVCEQAEEMLINGRLTL